MERESDGSKSGPVRRDPAADAPAEASSRAEGAADRRAHRNFLFWWFAVPVILIVLMVIVRGGRS